MQLDRYHTSLVTLFLLFFLSFFYLFTCAVKRRGILWRSNACWTVWETVVLFFLQTSEMPSSHLFLGLPWALYPDDLKCRARHANSSVCIHTWCPNHFIRCLSMYYIHGLISTFFSGGSIMNFISYGIICDFSKASHFTCLNFVCLFLI
jgi:hypothetical protein